MTRYMSNHVQTEGHNRDGKFTLRGAEEIRKEPQTWKQVYESSFELRDLAENKRYWRAPDRDVRWHGEIGAEWERGKFRLWPISLTAFNSVVCFIQRYSFVFNLTL